MNFVFDFVSLAAKRIVLSSDGRGRPPGEELMAARRRQCNYVPSKRSPGRTSAGHDSVGGGRKWASDVSFVGFLDSLRAETEFKKRRRAAAVGSDVARPPSPERAVSAAAPVRQKTCDVHAIAETASADNGTTAIVKGRADEDNGGDRRSSAEHVRGDDRARATATLASDSCENCRRISGVYVARFVRKKKRSDSLVRDMAMMDGDARLRSTSDARFLTTPMPTKGI